MPSQRFFPGLTALLGVIVFLLPWVLANTASTVAAPLSDAANWDLWIAGAAVALMGLAGLIEYRRWMDWGATILGVWLVASIWIFGFADATAIAWTAGVCGGLLALAGLASLLVGAGDRRFA